MQMNLSKYEWVPLWTLLGNSTMNIEFHDPFQLIILGDGIAGSHIIFMLIFKLFPRQEQWYSMKDTRLVCDWPIFVPKYPIWSLESE